MGYILGTALASQSYFTDEDLQRMEEEREKSLERHRALEFEKQKLIRQEQQKIQTLSTITPHDMAQYHRLESYKLGQEHLFEDYSDYQVFEYASESGAKLSDRVIKPDVDFMTMMKGGANEMYNVMVNYQLGMTNMWEDWVGIDEEDSAAMDAGYKQAWLESKEQEFIAADMPYTSDTLESEWNDAYEGLTEHSAWYFDKIDEHQKLQEEFIKSNPDILGMMYWAEHEAGFDAPLKYLTYLFTNVAPSVIATEVSGALGALIVGGGTALLTKNPIATRTAITTGWRLGSGLTGGAIENGSYSLAEINRLAQNKLVNERDMTKLIEEAGERYRNDKNLQDMTTELWGRPLSEDEYESNWASRKFQVLDDGRIISRGLSKEEALLVAQNNITLYTLSAMAIEQFSIPGDSFFRIKYPKLRPWMHTVDGFKQKLGISVMEKFSIKSARWADGIVAPGKINRVKQFIGYNGPRFIARGFGEGVEEVAQGMTQALTTALGPMGYEGFTRERYSPEGQTFLEKAFSVHGGWRQIRDEFFGGFLGGAVANGQFVINRVANGGIARQSKSIESAFKTGKEESFNYVERWNTESRMWDVWYLENRMQDGKIVSSETKLSDADTQHPDTGESVPTTFKRRIDAHNVASLYNKWQARTKNQATAWRYKDIRNGDVKLFKKENGKFILEFYNNDGELQELGDTEYDTKSEAKRERKNVLRFIGEVDLAFKRYGGEEGLRNTEGAQFEQSMESGVDSASQADADNRIASVDDNVEPSMSLINKQKLGIEYFVNDVQTYPGESTTGVIEEWKDLGMDKSPDVILDLVATIMNQPNGVEYLKRKKQQVLRNFTDMFSDVEGFDIKYKTLEETLTPVPVETTPTAPITPTVAPTAEVPTEEGIEIPTEEAPPTRRPEKPEKLEVPDRQEEIPFEKPPGVERPPGAPTGVAKSLADLTDAELTSKIASLETQVELTEEGTTARKIAEKSLEAAQKEASKRKRKLRKKSDLAELKKKYGDDIELYGDELVGMEFGEEGQEIDDKKIRAYGKGLLSDMHPDHVFGLDLPEGKVVVHKILEPGVKDKTGKVLKVPKVVLIFGTGGKLKAKILKDRKKKAPKVFKNKAGDTLTEAEIIAKARELTPSEAQGNAGGTLIKQIRAQWGAEASKIAENEMQKMVNEAIAKKSPNFDKAVELARENDHINLYLLVKHLGVTEEHGFILLERLKNEGIVEKTKRGKSFQFITKKAPKIEIDPMDVQMMYDEQDTLAMKKVLHNLKIEIAQMIKGTKIPFPVRNWKDKWINEEHRQLIVQHAPKSISVKLSSLLEEKSRLEEMIADIEGASLITEYMQIALFEEKDKKPPKKARKDIPYTQEELDIIDRETTKDDVRSIVSKLSENIKTEDGKSLEVNFIDDATEDAGSIQGKVITVNLAKVDMATPFHEFSHPIIQLIRLDNPKIYESLFNEAKKDEDLWKLIQIEYGDKSEVEQQDELIAFVLERISKKRQYKYNSKNKLIRTFQKIFDWIANKLGFNTQVDLFDVEAGLLTPNMTLDELSRIIVNHRDRYTITLTDKAFYPEVQTAVDSGLDVNSTRNDGLTSPISTVASNHTVTNILNDVRNSFSDLAISKKRKKGKLKNKDISKVIEKLTKGIRKTYSEKLELQDDANISKILSDTNKKDLILSDIKIHLSDYFPEIRELPEEQLEELAQEISSIHSKVHFAYRFSDMMRSPRYRDRTDFDMSQVGKKFLNKFKTAERDNILKFFNELQKDRKLTGEELAVAYETYSNNKTGLYFTSSNHAFDNTLYYNKIYIPSIAPSIIKPLTKEQESLVMDPEYASRQYNVQGYRNVLHMGKGYIHLEGAFLHEFPELNNGTGIGWYASLKITDGVLLHEFQSDITFIYF